jgi:hypothetical protein
MISRYDAYMDGIALSSLHADLAVLDIGYEPPSITAATSRHAVNSGVYYGSRYVEQGHCTITFELHIYNPQERQQACQAVARWAQGRVLKVSDRPGQHLNVVCEQYPVITSALRWTDSLSVSFVTDALPFWEDDADTIISLTNTSRSGQISVPGNVPPDICRARVNAVFKAGEAFTALRVTAGDTSIGISGIEGAQNTQITFSHDENGILGIKLGTSTSLLSKRTSNSSDDLLLDCGKKSTVSINRNGTCTIRVKGLWL